VCIRGSLNHRQTSMDKKRIDPITQKIIEAIGRHEEFLVLTHLNPDGDAVGSLLALGRVLAALGKSRHLLSPGEIPPECRFLVAAGEIRPSLPSMGMWDAVFVLDTPCSSRLPLSLSGQIPPCKELINIDHHAGNTIEGTLNWVDAKASSVGQMLYLLFEQAGYVVSPDVATPLYTAILTDTGSFRFPNTTSSALTAAAELVKGGADPAAIAGRVYASNSLRKYRLLAEALASLQMCCSGRGALMWVTGEMLRKSGASLLDTDGFENFPRKIEGVEVAILFKQKDDGHTVKVSLRSRTPLVDVSRVAGQFGGGGHRTAAGCIITGSKQFVQEKVLKAVAEELAPAGTARNSATAQTIPER